MGEPNWILLLHRKENQAWAFIYDEGNARGNVWENKTSGCLYVKKGRFGSLQRRQRFQSAVVNDWIVNFYGMIGIS